MTKHVYMLLGGLVGPDAYIPGMNNGMLALRDRIAKTIPGTITHTYTWDKWQSAMLDMWPRLFQTPRDKIIIVGFSGGGSRATFLANAIRSRNDPRACIDLLVVYDPSPKKQMLSISTSTVKRAICYHNNRPLMLGLGGGVLVGPQVETVEISKQHLLVQYMEELHHRTLEEIQKL